MQCPRLTSLAPAARRAAAVALATGLALALPSVATAQVQWRTGAGAAPVRQDKASLQRLVSELAARPDSKRAVAHFDATLSREQRDAARRAGLSLLDYVGSNAYFVTIEPDANPASIAALPGLVTLEAVRDVWKLHPDLAAGILRSWYVVDEINDPAFASGVMRREEAQARGLDPRVSVAVAFHRDVDHNAFAANLAKTGATVIHAYKTMKGMDVEIPLSQVYTLAAQDDVRWIEPALPPFSTLNDSNRVITGVDTVNAAPYSLDGTDIDVMVYDAGALANHPGLAGRITVGDGATPNLHPSHVGGTIGGTGAGETGNPHRGMAPGVRRFYSYDVGGFTAGYFRHIVGDTEADYLDAIADGADVANNSVGSNVSTNGWECSWHGDYGLFNEMLDTLIRGERNGQNGVPFRTIWAAGNERQSSRCLNQPNEPQGNLGFYQMAPPQAGKNQICVGAINSNDDSITDFTSFGPTDDGRLKPDFCAPGCQSGGDGGVTSCAGGNGYTALCGTSMASPTATGIAALFLQDWRAQFSGAPDPLNSTIKTIFAHTAVDIDDTGPDYRTGFGSIRAPRIIDHLRSGNFLEAEVDQGDVYSFIVVVSPQDTEFKVTIAWDDFRGTANVNPNLTNDLDIVVRDPAGNRHFPWTLDPATPDTPAVQSAENHRDNIEQVRVANPIPGGWVVQIRGTTVPEGPQKFSAAASPLLVNCSDAGLVAIEAAVVSCATPSVGVRVTDCGLNTSDTVVDTVAVIVSSTSDPTGEIVTLTETTAEAATFLGSAPLSSNGAPGTVRVSSGDTLFLTYIDADNGAGGTNLPVVASIPVDCTPPTLSDIAVSNIQPRSATVGFNASEPVIATIRYGTSCGNLSDMLDIAPYATTQSGTLTGLLDNTNYFYSVTAIDRAGNAATFNNSGNCFTFGTPDVPDYFTEIFSSQGNPQDLAMTRTTFTPNASVDGYNVCVQAATELGTDPVGGTVIAQGDNVFGQVTLADNATVSLYGQTYTSFFVGSNGYITFNNGDSASSESIASHFTRPRIAAHFDDLWPTAGQVTWRQLADHVAVTWLDVPECCSNNAPRNTFQIEMFFDGRIVITRLAMGSVDGLAGLSRGTGTPNDFLPSNLSALEAGCLPAPPYANNVNTACYLGTNADVTLIASDDGTPNPVLDFSIMSLPAHGALYDSAGARIASVPYALPTGTRVVRYRPAGLFFGNDAFTFMADDGGKAPSGGPSNVATVSVLVRSNQPAPVVQFLVDDANPNWTMSGGANGWNFGVPTGGGSFNHDPVSGFTGQNVIGFNLGGDYQNGIFPALYATSPAFSLAGFDGATLQFRRWLGIDASSFDRATLQLSTNGTTWNTVWAHSGAAISESSWSLQSYDISALADNQNSVQIRFGMGTTNGSVTYPGWNLDDIRVVARVDVAQCPCDWNGAAGLNSQDFFDFLTDFFSANADYNNSGATNSQDFFDFIACFFGGCQ